jgi:hypothetical protein
MTAALKGGEWSAACPGHTLPLGKTRYPLYRRLGEPQGQSGQAENLSPPGFDPRTVQPVVSRYTDPLHVVYYYTLIKNIAVHIEKSDCMYYVHQENWHFILCLSDQINII